jgi:hypothetical protein
MVNLLYCSISEDGHHIDKVKGKKKERQCSYTDMQSPFITRWSSRELHLFPMPIWYCNSIFLQFRRYECGQSPLLYTNKVKKIKRKVDVFTLICEVRSSLPSHSRVWSWGWRKWLLKLSTCFHKWVIDKGERKEK